MTSATPDRRPDSAGRREALDLGARTVPGAYWFRTDRRRSAYHPLPDAENGELSHCYSYERSQTSIKDAALELIHGARQKIFLASFRFVDDDLRRALQEAAARLRGGVYVITSIREADLSKPIAFTRAYEEGEETEEAEDESWNAGPDQAQAADIAAEEEVKHYSALIGSGVWVRGHRDFHAKFLVVDDRAALVSSANLESAALADGWDRPGRRRGFDPVTGESGVVTTRKSDAETLGRFFTRLWHAECVWDARPGLDYQLSVRQTTPSPCTVPAPTLGTAGPVWTGAGGQSVLEAVHDIIGRAEHDLVLATFSVQGLDKHLDLLHNPVQAALDRGVRVRLLMRRNNSAGARAAVGLLATWGVEVYGDDKTHAKCAIADGRRGALFSANFDAYHGMYHGVEMGMRLDGEAVLRDVSHFFEHCISHAPQRLVLDPTAVHAHSSISASALSKWPAQGEVTVSCDEGHWNALRHTTGPVLYSSDNDGSLMLQADGGKWRLAGRSHSCANREDGRPRRMVMVQAPGESRSGMDRGAQLLDYWLNPPGRGADSEQTAPGRHGLCPVVLVRV